jgi:hypothetical protein
LKATGNAPIMKKKKWAVDPEKKIGWIIEFMKKYLKLEHSERLVRFKTSICAFRTCQYMKKTETFISFNPVLAYVTSPTRLITLSMQALHVC